MAHARSLRPLGFALVAAALGVAGAANAQVADSGPVTARETAPEVYRYLRDNPVNSIRIVHQSSGDAGAATIRPAFPYRERVERGLTITRLATDFVVLSLPRLEFDLSTDDRPLRVTSLRAVVDALEPDMRALPVINGRSRGDVFRIDNAGWGTMSDVVVEFGTTTSTSCLRGTPVAQQPERSSVASISPGEFHLVRVGQVDMFQNCTFGRISWTDPVRGSASVPFRILSDNSSVTRMSHIGPVDDVPGNAATQRFVATIRPRVEDGPRQIFALGGYALAAHERRQLVVVVTPDRPAKFTVTLQAMEGDQERFSSQPWSVEVAWPRNMSAIGSEGRTRPALEVSLGREQPLANAFASAWRSGHDDEVLVLEGRPAWYGAALSQRAEILTSLRAAIAAARLVPPITRGCVIEPGGVSACEETFRLDGPS